MKLVQNTIEDFLKFNKENYPDNLAASFYDLKRRYTWSELYDSVSKIAKGLIAMGIKKGDHVAVWGINVPEWLLTQFAAGKIGAVVITINPEWKHTEVEYALNQSDTNVLVMMEGFEKPGKKGSFKYDYLGIINDLCPELKDQEAGTPLSLKAFPEMKYIVLTSNKELPGIHPMDKFIEKGRNISDETLEKATKRVHPDDIAMIQYTSGTTGFPKGAMLTQFNILNDARLTVAHLRLSAEDRICGPVPFYHCFGSILLNLGSLVTGAAVVVPSGIFNPHKTLEAIQNEKCTMAYGVPTMFLTELDQFDFKEFDLSRLRSGIMAGAPVDKELFEAVTKKMGASEMTIAYGLTEASPVTHQTEYKDPTEKRFNTVGKPVEHTQSKIVNPDTFEEVPIGEVGEIWVKGFQVMKGYYKKPKETKQAIVDGWLRTGDLGTEDEDGYVKIVGRLKEMLIVGGHNVYPAEVEQSLHSLFEDKVEMLQIVGIPHPKLQEQVAIVARCLPGQTLTLEEVKARCEGKLEWPKIPRYLKVMDDFSEVMTVTGKIQKFKIKELIEKEMLEMA